MKTLILILISIGFPIILLSQTLNLFPRGDVYATTKSVYAISTNPANLGKKTKAHCEYEIPILSGYGIITSTGLSNNRLIKIFFNRNEKIDDAEKNDLASFLVNEQTYLNSNWNFLSVAFNLSKKSRLGINVNSQATGLFNLNEQTADLLFKGAESSYRNQIFQDINSVGVNAALTAFTDGTSISLNSSTNYDVAYGYQFKSGKKANHYMGLGVRFSLYSLDINLISEAGNFSGYTTYLDAANNFDIKGFGRPNVVLKNLFDGKGGYGLFFNAGYSIETDKGLNVSMNIKNVGFTQRNRNQLVFNPNLVEDIWETLGSVDFFSALPEYLLSGGLFKVRGENTKTYLTTPLVIGSFSKTFLNSRLLLGVDATSNKDFKLISDVNLIDKNKLNIGIYSGMIGSAIFNNGLQWNIPVGFRFAKSYKKVNFGFRCSTYLLGYFNKERPTVNGLIGLFVAHGRD